MIYFTIKKIYLDEIKSTLLNMCHSSSFKTMKCILLHKYLVLF